MGDSSCEHWWCTDRGLQRDVVYLGWPIGPSWGQCQLPPPRIWVIYAYMHICICIYAYMHEGICIYAYMSPNAGGGGELAGPQPMSKAVHGSPKKLWRSYSIFSLYMCTDKESENQLLLIKNWKSPQFQVKFFADGGPVKHCDNLTTHCGLFY